MAQKIVIQDEKAQKFLAKAMKKAKEVGDGGRAFGMVLSSIVFRDVITHFEREESEEGKWDPWSEVYLQHMTSIGKGGNKILQDSGTLRQSFLPTSFRKVGEGILWFNPAKTKSGFAYAYHHNESREFMWLSEEASEKIADVTINYVLGKE